MSQKIFMSVFVVVTQYEFENFNNSYTEVQHKETQNSSGNFSLNGNINFS